MEQINWHRMFGLLLIDFFRDSPFEVELEKDLSIKKQLLDVVVLRKHEGVLLKRLPDGLDNLANHNLFTFKSHHEALTDWTLKEQTGHYVNYRKQVSPSFENLLPESDFRLYAVCSRLPTELSASPDWKALQDGVFELRRGSDTIRIIVLRLLPDAEHNAILHLLSASPNKIRYGAEHYQIQSSETSTLLDKLFIGYRREGVAMPYTMEDFQREYRAEQLASLTPEELLKVAAKLTPEQRLKLAGEVTPEERLKVAAQLTPDERLRGLSAKQIENYLESLKKKTPRTRKKTK